MKKNRVYSEYQLRLFKTVLTNELLSSYDADSKRFNHQIFFRKWFKLKGTSYFFLFHKNLKETNIQFAELYALLKNYTKFDESLNTGNKFLPSESEDDLPLNVYFHSTEDFNKTFIGMSETFADLIDNKVSIDQIIELVIKQYSLFFFNTIIFDANHGSASIFYPPHLEVELKEVIGLSGYIHSCGYGVYTRKLSKATKKDLYDALRNYVGIKNQNSPEAFMAKTMRDLPFYQSRPELVSKKSYLSVYCHEDYDKYDRKHIEYLKNGLEDIKIHLEKYYMGDDRLVNVIQEIRDDKFLVEKIYIPNSGDYKLEHANYRDLNKDNCTNSHTFFLLVDREIDIESGAPTDDLFYILYDQIYCSKNPIHIFSENKPAWIDHTTLPPSLTAAMMNLGISNINNDNKVIIADTFLSSGTTLFESFKYGYIDLTKKELKVKVIGGDYDELHEIAVLDNLYFFLNPKYLKQETLFNYFLRIFQKLEETEIYKIENDKFIFDARKFSNELFKYALGEGPAAFKDFDIFKEFIIKLYKIGPAEINSITVKHFRELIDINTTPDYDLTKYKDRIIKYLLLRTAVRHLIEIRREIIKQNSVKEREDDANDNHILNDNIINFIKIVVNSLNNEIKKIKTPFEKHNHLYSISLGKTNSDHFFYFPKESIGLLRNNNNDAFSEIITLNLNILDDYFNNIIQNGFKTADFKKYNILKEDEYKWLFESEEKFDILLTDPPYGFNTDEDIIELSKIYTAVLENTIQMFSKKSDGVGQILMCVPKSSQTGRKTYFFTSQEFITQQILGLADKYGIEIIPPNKFVPSPRNLFQAPYYWHSERALKRSVIHFRFRKKQD